jgi:OmpA-OmpF porin, OOP family
MTITTIFSMRQFFTLVLLMATTSLKAQVSPTNTLQLVNSVYDELNPVISPDGTTLYVTRSNHPQNVGGKKDPGDIWFAQWTGTQWSALIHGGSLLNDRAYNAIAGISGDGKQLFLHGHYDPTGSSVARTQGISLSKKKYGLRLVQTGKHPDSLFSE